jgi:hypothetical protein
VQGLDDVICSIWGSAPFMVCAAASIVSTRALFTFAMVMAAILESKCPLA